MLKGFLIGCFGVIAGFVSLVLSTVFLGRKGATTGLGLFLFWAGLSIYITRNQPYPEWYPVPRWGPGFARAYSLLLMGSGISIAILSMLSP